MSNRKLLGDYIELCEERNDKGEYGEDSVRGIATSKELITTKANLEGVSLTSYKVVQPGDFAYVPDTTRRGDKMSLGRNEETAPVLVSSISCVFRVKDHDVLDPDYLSMLFRRPEFDRYARFHSWGSAREAFSYADMCRVKIPLPPIQVQHAIVSVFQAARRAKLIAWRATHLSRNVCPALIQKAINS